jgi:hypothetical protein
MPIIKAFTCGPDPPTIGCGDWNRIGVGLEPLLGRYRPHRRLGSRKNSCEDWRCVYGDRLRCCW